MATTTFRALVGSGGRFAIVVHGGAGTIAPASEARHRAGCRRAAEAGRQLLESGASALDAVTRAVEVLESDPVFNAGVGSALNSDGDVELDAAIMCGLTLRAGGVCALREFEHPIAIARAALEDGRHVLYAAEGAAHFAVSKGFAKASAGSLVTEEARQRLSRALESAPMTSGGTVGAAAFDERGAVAAATSTGGTVAKRPGRVGDSPLVGAGVYADVDGAASATGHGEGIMRVALCHAVIRALSAGIEPSEAASRELERMKARVGSTGGLIAVDASGRVGVAFTTPSMSWAASRDGADTVDGV